MRHLVAARCRAQRPRCPAGRVLTCWPRSRRSDSTPRVARPNVYPLAWPTLVWRHYEEVRGGPVRDEAIEAAARAAAPTLAARIAYRAQAFADQRGLDRAFTRQQRLLRHAAVLAGAGGALLGLFAARLLPEGTAARANLFDLLGALLAPNLLALALWLVLQGHALLRGRGAAGSWLGGLLHRALDRAGNPRAARDELARAVQRGMLEYYADTLAGRARLALLSHLFWLALALGAMLGCWWLLSLRQVDFYWGSTLLGADVMTRVLECIARPVAWLGIAVPDAADVAASRVDVATLDPALRARWGWFLLAALGVFGVLPRALALLACTAMVAWGERHYLPDLRLPGYWRLRPLLETPPREARIIDPDEPAARRRAADGRAAVSPDAAQPPPPGAAWLALERSLTAPADAIDLGTSADRADQTRVLAALAADPDWPALVIHAPLAATPDRGVAHFVAALVAAARRPVYLRVAHDVGDWPDAARLTRIEDWHSLGLAAGIPASHLLSAA